MNEDSNLLELARQGDINAIETILNQQLSAKKITAKVVLKDSCLQVMLVSEQVPDQQFMAVFICKKITNLGIKSIERLKIYGKQIGDEFPAWSQQFELAGKPSLMPSNTEKASIYKSDNTNSLQNTTKIFERFLILNQYQLIGIAGVISLFIGLFIPVESIGSGSELVRQSFFDTGIVMPYDELIIILLSVVSLVLILENNKQKLLLGSGLTCFCFTLVGFIKSFQNELSFDATDVRLNKLYSQLLSGSPRTDFNVELIALGWIFLFIGSEFIIFSSLINSNQNKLINTKIARLFILPALVSVIIIVILCF